MASRSSRISDGSTVSSSEVRRNSENHQPAYNHPIIHESPVSPSVPQHSGQFSPPLFSSTEAISELPLSDIRPQRSAPKPPMSSKATPTGVATTSPYSANRSYSNPDPEEPPKFSADRSTITRHMSQSRHHYSPKPAVTKR